VYPLEASGTSGMKAGMNGVLNLSVLDGWWDEGFDGHNGWAITASAEGYDPQRRNLEESRALYEILQQQVIPAYYARGEGGYSPEWLRMAKRSIATLLPQFSATRMVDDYVRKLYKPALAHAAQFASRADGIAELVAWKTRVANAWPQVVISTPERSTTRLVSGDKVRVEVGVKLGGLSPRDLQVELLLERQLPLDHDVVGQDMRFVCAGEPVDDVQHYTLEMAPAFCGSLYFFVRVYPFHELLAHRFETGLMRWA
jgi:starch phosphorylase